MPRKHIIVHCDTNFAIIINGKPVQRVSLDCQGNGKWMTKEGWVPSLRCEGELYLLTSLIDGTIFELQCDKMYL